MLGLSPASPGFVVLEIGRGLLRLKTVQCLLRLQSAARGSDLVRRSGHRLEMSNMNIYPKASAINRDMYYREMLHAACLTFGNR